MLISIILITLIALAGVAITYLFAEDEPLLWRVTAGIVIASSIYGTLLFLISSFAGLSYATS